MRVALPVPPGGSLPPGAPSPELRAGRLAFAKAVGARGDASRRDEGRGTDQTEARTQSAADRSPRSAEASTASAAASRSDQLGNPVKKQQDEGRPNRYRGNQQQQHSATEQVSHSAHLRRRVRAFHVANQAPRSAVPKLGRVAKT